MVNSIVSSAFNYLSSYKVYISWERELFTFHSFHNRVLSSFNSLSLPTKFGFLGKGIYLLSFLLLYYSLPLCNDSTRNTCSKEDHSLYNRVSPVSITCFQASTHQSSPSPQELLYIPSHLHQRYYKAPTPPHYSTISLARQSDGARSNNKETRFFLCKNGVRSKNKGTIFFLCKNVCSSSTLYKFLKVFLVIITLPNVQELMMRCAMPWLHTFRKQAKSAEKHTTPRSSSSAQSHLENLEREDAYVNITTLRTTRQRTGYRGYQNRKRSRCGYQS